MQRIKWLFFLIKWLLCNMLCLSESQKFQETGIRVSLNNHYANYPHQSLFLFNKFIVPLWGFCSTTPPEAANQVCWSDMTEAMDSLSFCCWGTFENISHNVSVILSLIVASQLRYTCLMLVDGLEVCEIDRGDSSDARRTKW